MCKFLHFYIVNHELNYCIFCLFWTIHSKVSYFCVRYIHITLISAIHFAPAFWSLHLWQHCSKGCQFFWPCQFPFDKFRNYSLKLRILKFWDYNLRDCEINMFPAQLPWEILNLGYIRANVRWYLLFFLFADGDARTGRITAWETNGTLTHISHTD